MEEELFDINDGDTSPNNVDDVDECLSFATRVFTDNTGRKWPDWRSSQVDAPIKNTWVDALSVNIPWGRFFYPCSASDTHDSLSIFQKNVSEFHFSDPFHPIRRSSHKLLTNEKNEICIPFIGKILNDPGSSCELEISSSKVISHQKDGLLTLLEDLEDISIFYYRGDSGGEGGSGQFWMGSVLFDLVLSRILPGGLICTDGSNGAGFPCNQLRSGSHINILNYRELVLTRLPVELKGKRRPMVVWQVNK